MVDQTPMRDRPPKDQGPWLPVDSRRLLPAADLEQVRRLVEMSRELEQLVRRLPAVLHMMRDAMAGQPPSALAGLGADEEGERPPLLWCWEHHRSTVDCDAEGLLCEGEMRVGPSDRVGNAAMVTDRAARDHRALLAEAERLVSSFQKVFGLAAGYPTDVMERASLDEGDAVGSTWCVVCWKDDKHCEPITMRGSGQPYYRDRCKWCGKMTAELGAEPPTWLVEKRHRGERITKGDVERARRQVGAPTPKRERPAGAKRGWQRGS